MEEEQEVVSSLAEKILALEQEKEDEESWLLPLQLPQAVVEEGRGQRRH